MQLSASLQIGLILIQDDKRRDAIKIIQIRERALADTATAGARY